MRCRRSPVLSLVIVALALSACEGDDEAAGGMSGGNSSAGPGGGASNGSSSSQDSTDGGTKPGAAESGTALPDGSLGGGPPPSVASKAAALAIKLRGKSNFMFGLGNDLAQDHAQDGAYTVGTPLDVHYAYLVGLLGQGGWPDWNANGSFVNMLADEAAKHQMTPMFTLYSMAAWGEANASTLTNDDYMKRYWDGARLLFQRLAMFAKPAVVQFEPDFWGFAMQIPGGASAPVHVKSLAPECAAHTDDIAGMARCMVTLARGIAPNVAVGFHVSGWGGDLASTIAFFKAIDAPSADFITTDMLDRDAGCFEAHVDPNCQRGGTTGWYWDETNTTSPNFHEHLDWVTSLTTSLGVPMLWWQVPLGVPSNTPGGTPGHYRDNRAHYIFSHVGELIAAGGAGAFFGTGAGNQTYITSDGDQFKNATAQYYGAPVPLP